MFIIDEALHEDYLSHHGVKGMKWGVRKNPSKAYREASTQANKYRKSIDSADRGTKKATVKSTRNAYRLAKAVYRGKNTDKINRLRDNQVLLDAELAQIKKDRLQLSKDSKAWDEAMTKYFKGIKVSQIDPKDLEVGRAYMSILTKDD